VATWPAGLPQKPLADGFSEQAQPIILRTDMDVGPAKMRRRYTSEVRVYGMEMLLTTAQVATLETFYYSTLDCVDPFDWLNHRTGAAATYRFRSPPAYSEAGAPGYWRTSLDLESFP
jgi:hypothetical protein